jgi:hypothetical protein
LLLSSITDAAFYQWYINEDELIGSNKTPYFYLTDEIYEDHHINDLTVFTVRIAFQETGCYTTGYMCQEIMCAGNDEFNLMKLSTSSIEDLSISIQSNPVKDNLYLKAEGNYLGQFEVLVYTMSGSLIFSNQLIKAMPLEYHEVDFQAKLNPGIYILTCLYNGKRSLPVKMIVY